MPVSRSRLRWLVRPALIAANVVALALIVATGALVWIESGWTEPQFRDPQQAFRHGTTGTELVPLSTLVALPVIFPEHLQPGGGGAGDWVEQFGFLRSPDDPDGLPIGFATTRYRPQSGAPSPIDFVGFSCALCHTTAIRADPAEEPRIVTGPGSVSLNLFAWIDAFRAALLEREPLDEGEVLDPDDPPPYRLTTARIADAYREVTGSELGAVERFMTSLWLRQFRTRLEAGLPRFDEPFGRGLSRDPRYVPTGPTRTEPFRTLIREVLQRPGNDMPVYTKIATVFSQDIRERAQFDGSIADLNARSSLAALAAGATATNMALPEVAHNIRAASSFTETLRAPDFATLFPDQLRPDPAALARGRAVYADFCAGCHGDRDPQTGNWAPGPRTGEVVPLAEIGTDPERVMFRHYGALAGRLHALFDREHPFHFGRDQIFPQPGREDDLESRGYLNAPIDGAYLRAPYLHNASVLTLAELINLQPRRPVFYRGFNLYDPVNLGFQSPEEPDAARYFRFDTRLPGNSNHGHDYPWAYDDPRRSVEDLEALLAYLKTL